MTEARAALRLTNGRNLAMLICATAHRREWANGDTAAFVGWAMGNPGRDAQGTSLRAGGKGRLRHAPTWQDFGVVSQRQVLPVAVSNGGMAG